jgi:tellurite resistance protein
MNIETATIRRLRDALLQSGRRGTVIVSSAYQTLTREGLLSNTEVAALAQVDPMAETMFLMMAADGKLTSAEKDAIRGAVRGLTADLLQDGTIDVMLENYQAGLERDGRDRRLEQIAKALARSPDDAQGAFALAAAVALADDELATAESAFIAQLAEWFAISKRRAKEILDQLEEDRRDHP